MGTLLGLGSKRGVGTHHYAHLLTPSPPCFTKNIPKPTIPQLVLHLRIPISRNNLLRRQLHPRRYAFLCVNEASKAISLEYQDKQSKFSGIYRQAKRSGNSGKKQQYHQFQTSLIGGIAIFI